MDGEERLRRALADRYAIERVIGVGGMATVYLATDLKLGRKVAVKVLDPELSHVLGPERFLREVRTAAGLTHPHILPVYDSGEADGFLFYVMPYVEGETLRARLTKEKQLPVSDAIQITREIASALAHAHQEGVIHRDVKPANIMLEAGQAVLADFGVAHAVAEAGGERITRPGTSVGTVGYMSPEQAAGHDAVDGRSDIYALGCILFEMLAGEPPFTGATPSAVMARQISERLPSLDLVRPNLPRGVVEATERALAKVPADRYRKATEFASAVQEGLSGEFRTPSSRPRIPPGALAVLTLVAVALITLYAVATAGGGPEPPSPLGAPSRIAVTYFNVASPDPALVPLGDALTEYVADGLVKLETFEVLPLNAMRPYRGIGLSPDDVEDLDIDAYVEGSLMGTAEQVSVSVQLIDARGARHIASEVVEGNAGAPFAIMGDLSEEISGLLRDWLGVEIDLAELQAGTESEDAWNLVQLASRRMNDGIDLHASGDTVAATRALLEADGLLEEAESADPSYLAPIVNRGWVASELARMGTAQVRFEENWTRVGLDHARRALEKDPDDPRALELRGILRDYLASETSDLEEADSLWAEAEADLLRATRLDPSRSQAYARLSRIYQGQGRDAEAKLNAEKAYSADPYQRDARVILYRLCSSALNLRVWSEVTRWCEAGMERYPNAPGFPSAALSALAGPRGPVPDPERAWLLADLVNRLSPPHLRGRRVPTHELLVAAVLARAGLPDSARAVIAGALSHPEAGGPMMDVFEANARLQLGDQDGALNALGRYLEAVPGARPEVASDWWWEELWEHPRFLEMTRQTGGFPEPAVS